MMHDFIVLRAFNDEDNLQDHARREESAKQGIQSSQSRDFAGYISS